MGIAGKQHLPDDNNTDVPPLPPMPTPRHIPPPPNKKKLNEKETGKTAKLSTAELQRLVLLEQLQLTRMQIEREQIMLNMLRETPMERFNYVVDVNSGKVYADM
ncbi:hypothetical protein JTB14_008518 [Gonioctena quinquepunctata]|nr:hypothetical protein JTB14_008518 [Gonioctena quinquepunctata]